MTYRYLRQVSLTPRAFQVRMASYVLSVDEHGFLTTPLSDELVAFLDQYPRLWQRVAAPRVEPTAVDSEPAPVVDLESAAEPIEPKRKRGRTRKSKEG